MGNSAIFGICAGASAYSQTQAQAAQPAETAGSVAHHQAPETAGSVANNVGGSLSLMA